MGPSAQSKGAERSTHVRWDGRYRHCRTGRLRSRPWLHVSIQSSQGRQKILFRVRELGFSASVGRFLDGAEWAKLGNPSESDRDEGVVCWTWGRLGEEYKLYLSEMREDATGRAIYPSEDSQSDVRGIFGRPEVARHDGRSLNDLDETWFEDVQEVLHKTYGFDAYRKFRAYGQAALNWAKTFRRKDSGLDGRAWWLLAEKRRRTKTEVEKKVERDKALLKKKAAFKVEHLGMALDRHERYCASRTGNERVSPGVRWGFWWDALTGHRRGSGTWVALEDVQFQDPRGKPGWGLATWQPDILKTHDPFAFRFRRSAYTSCDAACAIGAQQTSALAYSARPSGSSPPVSPLRATSPSPVRP